MMSATPCQGAAGVMMVQPPVWGSVWKEEMTVHLTKALLGQLTSAQGTDGTL